MLGKHMTKRIIIVISAFIGLIIASLSITFGFDYLVEHNQWFGLIIGVVFMAIGLIVFQWGKQRPLLYVLSFIFNMIGVGLSITAYYVLKAYALAFYDFLFAIGVAMALLIGFSLFTKIKWIRKHLKFWLVVVIMVSFVSSLILWIVGDSFTGLSFYFLNVIYFFMVSVIKDLDDKKDTLRELAIISFGSFILVSLVVLIILSEGEALQGIDGFGMGGKSKKSK